MARRDAVSGGRITPERPGEGELIGDNGGRLWRWKKTEGKRGKMKRGGRVIGRLERREHEEKDACSLRWSGEELRGERGRRRWRERRRLGKKELGEGAHQ